MIEISDSQIIASIQRAAFQAVFEAFKAETSNILKIGLDYKLILYRNELVYSVIVQKPNRNSKDFFDCEIVCEKYAPFGVENSKSNRLTPTTFAMLANAQALINMARKRLCRKASPETRMIMSLIKNAVFYVDPKLSSCLNPDCLYRGGKCHELFSCGCYPKA